MNRYMCTHFFHFNVHLARDFQIKKFMQFGALLVASSDRNLRDFERFSGLGQVTVLVGGWARRVHTASGLPGCNRPALECPTEKELEQGIPKNTGSMGLRSLPVHVLLRKESSFCKKMTERTVCIYIEALNARPPRPFTFASHE